MLASERLQFSDVSLDADITDFQAYLLKENYWRHIPIEIPTAEWVENFLRMQSEAALHTPRSSYHFAVRDRLTGIFVGEANLTPWGGGAAYIGWGVTEELCGRGFATEIGATMIRFGFDYLGLHRIGAMCKVSNEASRRIMEKLGMRQEGIMREHMFARGEWWSSWLYAVLSTDPLPFGPSS